jgi:hypothetical protein
MVYCVLLRYDFYDLYGDATCANGARGGRMQCPCQPQSPRKRQASLAVKSRWLFDEGIALKKKLSLGILFVALNQRMDSRHPAIFSGQKIYRAWT